MTNQDYVPHENLYPECCDYKFCQLLQQAGILLPFMDFNDNKPEQDFYGFVV